MIFFFYRSLFKKNKELTKRPIDQSANRQIKRLLSLEGYFLKRALLINQSFIHLNYNRLIISILLQSIESQAHACY